MKIVKARITCITHTLYSRICWKSYLNILCQFWVSLQFLFIWCPPLSSSLTARKGWTEETLELYCLLSLHPWSVYTGPVAPSHSHCTHHHSLSLSLSLSWAVCVCALSFFLSFSPSSNSSLFIGTSVIRYRNTKVCCARFIIIIQNVEFVVYCNESKTNRCKQII